MHKTAAQKKLATEKKHKKGAKSSKKHRKWGRNERKCERYRNLIGKPNGPGKPGNKSGKNKN